MPLLIGAALPPAPTATRMRVRLLRKLAEVIDGVDLHNVRVGDTLDLAEHEAQILIAEGWATQAPDRSPARGDKGGRSCDAEPHRRLRRRT